MMLDVAWDRQVSRAGKSTRGTDNCITVVAVGRYPSQVCPAPLSHTWEGHFPRRGTEGRSWRAVQGRKQKLREFPLI